MRQKFWEDMGKCCYNHFYTVRSSSSGYMRVYCLPFTLSTELRILIMDCVSPLPLQRVLPLKSCMLRRSQGSHTNIGCYSCSLPNVLEHEITYTVCLLGLVKQLPVLIQKERKISCILWDNMSQINNLKVHFINTFFST